MPPPTGPIQRWSGPSSQRERAVGSGRQTKLLVDADNEPVVRGATRTLSNVDPVLFDRQYFDALRAVDGDRGRRDVLLESERAALVEVEDPGVTVAIDTPADLNKLYLC